MYSVSALQQPDQTIVDVAHNMLTEINWLMIPIKSTTAPSAR